MTDISSLVDSVLSVQNVEYRKLGDVATIVRGKGLQKKDFTESGVGCIHYGQIYTSFGPYTEKTLTFVNLDDVSRFTIVSKGDIIMAVTGENTEDICKSVAWLGDEDIVTGSHSAVIKHSLDPKYLSYYFQSEAFFQKKKTLAHGTKVIEVTPSDLEDVLIPVPSMDVQRAIVEILDSFSSLVNDCTDELSLRRVQKGYLRELIVDRLESDPSVKKVTVKDVAVLARETIPTAQINPKQYVGVENLVSGGGLIVTNSVPKVNACLSFKKNDILVGNIRPYLKKIWFAEFDGGTNGDVVIISPKAQVILPKYLYYLMNSDQFFSYDNQYAKGGKMPRGDRDMISQFKVPLPSLEVQSEIIDSLSVIDSYIDNLCDELSNRIAQYEYYLSYILAFGE